MPIEPHFRVLNSANYQNNDAPVWNSQTGDFEPRPFSSPPEPATLDFAPFLHAFPTRGRNYLVTCDFTARGQFVDAFFEARLTSDTPLFITSEVSRQSATGVAFLVFVPLAGGSYSDAQNAALTLHLHGLWTQSAPQGALIWTVEGPI